MTTPLALETVRARVVYVITDWVRGPMLASSLSSVIEQAEEVYPDLQWETHTTGASLKAGGTLTARNSLSQTSTFIIWRYHVTERTPT